MYLGYRCYLLSFFEQINFEVWNINERKKLLTFNCGGGHRPWDFVIDKLVRFVYMREKVITYIILPSSKLLNMSSLMVFDNFNSDFY